MGDLRVHLLLAAFVFSIQGSYGSGNERRLFHDLFEKEYYTPLERPVEDDTKPIVVNFTLILQQIIDVDEKNQIINTNIWLQMKWIAANLRWDPEEYGGIDTIRVPAAEMWTPDILMYNSADEKFDGTFHTKVTIKNDGSCLWVPPGMFKSTCSIDITWFPFDDQLCDLKFGSWTYDGRMLDLQMEDPNGGDITTFIRNGEWELIALPGIRNIQDYDCCPEFFIDLTYTIHIRRRTLYYGFNIIIPCLLISSMSLLLFLLPCEAGEKISLGVTILLSLMVFLLLVAETMPPTSDALPLIGVYFSCIMVMTSLSILFTVVVLNFHYRSPDTHVLPTWVRYGINVVLARLLCMSRPRTADKSRNGVINRQRLGDVQTATTLLPNLLESEEEYHVHSEKAVNSNSRGVSDYTWQPSLSRDGGPVDDVEKRRSADSSDIFTGKGLFSILSEVKKITTKIKDDDEETEVRNEWRFAALVIDRLCLWVCMLMTIISTAAILLSAPHLVA